MLGSGTNLPLSTKCELSVALQLSKVCMPNMGENSDVPLFAKVAVAVMPSPVLKTAGLGKVMLKACMPVGELLSIST